MNCFSVVSMWYVMRPLAHVYTTIRAETSFVLLEHRKSPEASGYSDPVLSRKYIFETSKVN